MLQHIKTVVYNCVLSNLCQQVGEDPHIGLICMYECVFVLYRWLDKLGLAAKLGLDVVMRQVLIGSGTYHLVDNNLDPLPV